MQCSGCGATIPVAGSVCPYCGSDKSDDKRYEWFKYIGGIIGLFIGFSTFDSFIASVICFFPGYILGAIIGFIISSMKTRTETRTFTQFTPPKAKDSAQEKLAQLKKMNDQGLITAEEYANKKAEILDKL